MAAVTIITKLIYSLEQFIFLKLWLADYYTYIHFKLKLNKFLITQHNHLFVFLLY